MTRKFATIAHQNVLDGSKKISSWKNCLNFKLQMIRAFTAVICELVICIIREKQFELCSSN